MSSRRLLLPLLAAAGLFAGASGRLLGTCGPFTDVAADSFCPFVEEIFLLGITTGITPTTYEPESNVSRLQMAAFLSRTVDGALRRGSPRAFLNRFWTPGNDSVLDVTTIGSPGSGTRFPAFDGLDIWVPTIGDGTVARVRASDGGLLGTWTGATFASFAASAIGKVFATGRMSPGALYRIDPRQQGGVVTTVASNLGANPNQLAFDGTRFWTANAGPPGSVSIVVPGATIPWTVTTVTVGFGHPNGVLFDGADVWITDSAFALVRVDSTGAKLQTVTVAAAAFNPGFDGANIWVPHFTKDSVSVVRASTGMLLATLTGNGLTGPVQAAFDGERVLITNNLAQSVSLWKAADLTAIGSVSTGPGAAPLGVCTDRVGFWITMRGNQIARF